MLSFLLSIAGIRRSGSGLGLAELRRIAALHGIASPREGNAARLQLSAMPVDDQ